MFEPDAIVTFKQLLKHVRERICRDSECHVTSHSCDEPVTVQFLQGPPAHYEYFASSSEYAVRIELKNERSMKESEHTVNLSRGRSGYCRESYGCNVS